MSGNIFPDVLHKNHLLIQKSNADARLIKKGLGEVMKLLSKQTAEIRDLRRSIRKQGKPACDIDTPLEQQGSTLQPKIHADDVSKDKFHSLFEIC